MNMKLFLALIIFLFARATSTFGQEALPESGRVCVLNLAHVTMTFSCDGNPSITLEPIPNELRFDPAQQMSGQVAKLLNAGFALISCDGTTCIFVK